MSRLAAPMSDDHISSFFKVGKPAPKLDTVARSALGGRNLDPKTGKAAVYEDKRFVPNYKRNPRRNNPNQQAYAQHYRELEEENLRRGLTQDDDGDDDAASTTTGGMYRLESISMTTGQTASSLTLLPEGMTEEEANDVYTNYNFRVQYDESLAIYKMKQDIVDTIESNQVTVIQGETGSGKTTQVPQYILDHYAQNGKYCNIVVTQPRRIAAMSISRRVCHERNWELGRVCGYQVGMDRQMSEDTRLLYVTTGVLLQKLITNKHMNDYTHIILDEVHERDQETDFALLVVRKMLWNVSRDVKVVLMSATFESKRFAEYFAVAVRDELYPAPVLDVKGRSFTVQEYHLEDLKQLSPELPNLDLAEPKIDPQMYEIVKLLINQFDNMEASADTKNKVLPNGLPAKRGSVLIFLPGLGEINDMEDKLREVATQRNLRLLPLHSTITTEEQARVFDKPTQGHRKIIMSTNIAESSITVPDIKYVIDFCLTKNLMCDADTAYTSLQLQWASKANCKQRMGRAGRVSDGRVYRLVYRRFYHELPEFGDPEMQRCPLDIVVLKVKRLDMGAPKALLGLALDPPGLDDIECTVLMLKEVGALVALDENEADLNVCDPHDGKLTFLGRVVGGLPLDIRLGKLIMLGHVFGLLEECIIISASLSMKTFFSAPYKAHLEAYRKKFEWADESFSDCLAYLFAYKAWKNYAESGRFPALKDEMRWARENYIQLRRIKDVEKMVEELRSRLKSFNIVTPTGPNRRPVDIMTEDNQLILKVVICGAFYPNYFTIGHTDEEEASRALGGHNPFTTVMVRGLPANQGSLYRQNVEEIFTKCDSRGKKPRVHFEETKAYIEFHRDPGHPTTRILPAVYMALKLKQIGARGVNRAMEFPQLDPETARHQLNKLSMLQDSQSGSHQVLRTNRVVTEGDAVLVDDSSSTMMRQVDMPPPSDPVIQLVPTVISECGSFWAHYGDDDTLKKLRELQDHIDRTRNLPQLMPQDRQLMNICLAPYRDCDQDPIQYYRARIERLDNIQQKAEVFFVDYGNVEVVPYHSLRELEHHFRGLHFQAFECQLSSIKPSAIKCPNGHWTKEALEVFRRHIKLAQLCYAEVYSIVHNVMRLVMHLKDQYGKVINVNDKLVTLCFADRAEEDFASKHNHQQREEEKMGSPSAAPPPARSAVTDRVPLPMHDFGDLNTQTTSFIRKRGGKIHLSGPIHPYEINFYNMTNIGRLRTCRTDMSSVNCVALDGEPHIQHARLMVASYVGLNPGGNVMQARDTTLMPSIPALPGLMAMLFTPLAEFRASPDKKRYSGVLCGLGWDVNTGGPAHGDHDMEITFDTVIDLNDIVMVNKVRMAINLAIGGNDVEAKWGPDAIAHIQKSVREKFLMLFLKRREPVEKVYYNRQFCWNQLDVDDILRPTVENMEEQGILYNLHNAIALVTSDAESDDQADDDNETQRQQQERQQRQERQEQQERLERQEQLAEQREHLQWLHSQASRSPEPRIMRCEFCNVAVKSPLDLFTHLQRQSHKAHEQRVLAHYRH